VLRGPNPRGVCDENCAVVLVNCSYHIAIVENIRDVTHPTVMHRLAGEAQVVCCSARDAHAYLLR
jgi:hypothetical protein